MNACMYASAAHRSLSTQARADSVYVCMYVCMYVCWYGVCMYVYMNECMRMLS